MPSVSEGGGSSPNWARAWAAGDAVRFGPFTLHPVQRVLLMDDSPVPLGSRAFDILCLLVERSGTFVSKDDIIEKVWAGVSVADGNLRVHMAGLRKALGDGRDGQRYIVTVPHRGYSFVASLQHGSADPSLPGQAVAPSAGNATIRLDPTLTRSLPAPLHRVIGRAQAFRTLTEQIAKRRLVTVVGPGGIGKTTLAVTAAAAIADHRARASWGHVHFVDLALIADPRLVASALASVLGLSAVVADALPSLLAFLHDKELLILFDNCEHVVETVASVAEAILRGAPGVHILATSREPLRAEGEWVQHLQPLTTPASPAATAGDAMSYSAIELFVERAAACSDAFALRDEDVPAVIEICRRLDGIPLAIELAAARVDSLSVSELADALDDRFALLTKGRRTALPRHRTLRATFDWSFNLLPEREAILLQRLSVFAGEFTLDSACIVAASKDLTAFDIVDGISDLVARSLVVADVSREETFFRLLDTTRAYAREKLALGSDRQSIARRHAEHCRDLLLRSEQLWPASTTVEWLSMFGRLIDDVRAAMEWAFTAEGDAVLGIEITAKSAPLFFQLSFADEFRQRAENALQAAACLPSVPPMLEFELNIVTGHVIFHTRGLQPESATAFERALELAEAAQDRAMLAMAFSSNWMGAYTRGEPAVMMEFARRFEDLTRAGAGPDLALMYDRMKAPALHFLGDQRAARGCAERSLDAPLIRPPFLTGSQIDRRVSMGSILARVLWVQGEFEAAEEMAERTVDIARREGESVALGYTLAFTACPIAIWNGHWDLARQRVAMLLRHTREHALAAWQGWGAFHEEVLACLDDPARKEGLIERIATTDLPPQLRELLATFDPALAAEPVFAWGESGRSGWCAPELLRVRALRAAPTDTGLAEMLLQQALSTARQGDMLAWELRSAITLARLWGDHGRSHDAHGLLRALAERVGGAFETPDTRALAELRGR